jgi:hypothetical protein
LNEPPADPPAESRADIPAPSWSSSPPDQSSAPGPEGKLDLNQATYDQLRQLKLSVTHDGPSHNSTVEFRDTATPAPARRARRAGDS